MVSGDFTFIWTMQNGVLTPTYNYPFTINTPATSIRTYLVDISADQVACHDLVITGNLSAGTYSATNFKPQVAFWRI